MHNKPKRYVFKLLTTIEETEFDGSSGDYEPTEADQKSVVLTVPIFAYSFEEAERHMQRSLLQVFVVGRR